MIKTAPSATPTGHKAGYSNFLTGERPAPHNAILQGRNRILFRYSVLMVVLTGCFASLLSCDQAGQGLLTPERNLRVVMIGNNLCSRMSYFGHLESELQLRAPDSLLFIRNMCDSGNTPVFRPHASRNSPWAFPGAEKFEAGTALAAPSTSIGHFPSEDEWLSSLKADVILAFFGYNESFEGAAGLEKFSAGLEAFIRHSLNQQYNGENSPKLILVSPIAFENLSGDQDLPDGRQENENLELYTQAMKEVADIHDIPFIDVFHPSKSWYAAEGNPLTQDGFQLNDLGYTRLSAFLADALLGERVAHPERRKSIRKAVLEKNWFWLQDFKIPNGVHAYGRRYNPFGPQNYPYEIEKIRQMTLNRDSAIWEAVRGKDYDLEAADARTRALPEVPSNFEDFPSEGTGNTSYLYGEEALSKITVAPGYRMDLFASEKEFPNLANPSQLSFDNKGRLWVGVMPSYPHYRPGDGKPNDKLLILEDTDGDGKADRETVFADSLHLPVGFELAPEGVYVSQGNNLVLLTDEDGDDQADTRQILLSGFDDHDTHHAISAFTADPSGAIYMGEGVFLHSNVETAYGPVRATNGGFYRYSPQRHRLERTAQLSIPNPWGIAFDDWGQPFFLHTSGPNMTWMTPGTIQPRYGEFSPMAVENIIEEAHLVRPTSGLEFISSRHFPPEVQGDFILNNTIGFLGTKMHTLSDQPDSAGYVSEHRMDLVTAADPNFRPVDMEFAPDGSLYIADWHNILIGHMQHNARDPLRDHVHGRVYRLTYPSRPLVRPARIAGAEIPELLDNLKAPEYRTRYRTRRELRGRNPNEVMSDLGKWVDSLDPEDADYEHHLLEALWVSWGMNRIDRALLLRLLEASDFRARAAAVKVLRYVGHQIPEQADLLLQAARDPHPRVRLEALVAASWLPADQGLPIVKAAGELPLDRWMKEPYEAALAHLNDRPYQPEETGEIQETDLQDQAREHYLAGKEIYEREGFCITCHQADGMGLSASGFPPLSGSSWVTGNPDRLIQLTLHGLMGPIEVNGKTYPGTVPMTPFGGMLNDEEIASVLTYIRNAFGNEAEPVTPEHVKEARAASQGRKGFYTAGELREAYPDE